MFADRLLRSSRLTGGRSSLRCCPNRKLRYKTSRSQGLLGDFARHYNALVGTLSHEEACAEAYALARQHEAAAAQEALARELDASARQGMETGAGGVARPKGMRGDKPRRKARPDSSPNDRRGGEATKTAGAASDGGGDATAVGPADPFSRPEAARACVHVTAGGLAAVLRGGAIPVGATQPQLRSAGAGTAAHSEAWGVSSRSLAPLDVASARQAFGEEGGYDSWAAAEGAAGMAPTGWGPAHELPQERDPIGASAYGVPAAWDPQQPWPQADGGPAAVPYTAAGSRWEGREAHRAPLPYGGEDSMDAEAAWQGVGSFGSPHAMVPGPYRQGPHQAGGWAPLPAAAAQEDAQAAWAGGNQRAPLRQSAGSLLYPAAGGGQPDGMEAAAAWEGAGDFGCPLGPCRQEPRPLQSPSVTPRARPPHAWPAADPPWADADAPGLRDRGWKQVHGAAAVQLPDLRQADADAAWAHIYRSAWGAGEGARGAAPSPDREAWAATAGAGGHMAPGAQAVEFLPSLGPAWGPERPLRTGLTAPAPFLGEAGEPGPSAFEGQSEHRHSSGGLRAVVGGSEPGYTASQGRANAVQWHESGSQLPAQHHRKRPLHGSQSMPPLGRQRAGAQDLHGSAPVRSFEGGVVPHDRVSAPEEECAEAHSCSLAPLQERRSDFPALAGGAAHLPDPLDPACLAGSAAGGFEAAPTERADPPPGPLAQGAASLRRGRLDNAFGAPQGPGGGGAVTPPLHEGVRGTGLGQHQPGQLVFGRGAVPLVVDENSPGQWPSRGGPLPKPFPLLARQRRAAYRRAAAEGYTIRAAWELWDDGASSSEEVDEEEEGEEPADSSASWLEKALDGEEVAGPQTGAPQRPSNWPQRMADLCRTVRVPPPPDGLVPAGLRSLNNKPAAWHERCEIEHVYHEKGLWGMWARGEMNPLTARTRGCYR
ncbi:hypothetical protein HYH03_006693 [Edaphochlamys debaryana]|uniref:Uncharacterized protein n=1 Tax=Edaphochlamys debaryana TaxID=47281 RepID=A0A835Y4M0_9CHLO|nr:hypothetical protein HYH03_006693 [Edaphochlamys debaryana]|eukprot:KAG2495082.1 hypothetical protein HYH03_006693 [Edaphochlamys debaryana]